MLKPKVKHEPHIERQFALMHFLNRKLDNKNLGTSKPSKAIKLRVLRLNLMVTRKKTRCFHANFRLKMEAATGALYHTS